MVGSLFMNELVKLDPGYLRTSHKAHAVDVARSNDARVCLHVRAYTIT